MILTQNKKNTYCLLNIQQNIQHILTNVLIKSYSTSSNKHQPHIFTKCSKKHCKVRHNFHAVVTKPAILVFSIIVTVFPILQKYSL